MDVIWFDSDGHRHEQYVPEDVDWWDIAKAILADPRNKVTSIGLVGSNTDENKSS